MDFVIKLVIVLIGSFIATGIAVALANVISGNLKKNQEYYKVTLAPFIIAVVAGFLILRADGFTAEDVASRLSFREVFNEYLDHDEMTVKEQVEKYVTDEYDLWELTDWYDTSPKWFAKEVIEDNPEIIQDYVYDYVQDHMHEYVWDYLYDHPEVAVEYVREYID